MVGILPTLLVLSALPLVAQKSVVTFERRVDVGGYSLWIRCSGQGSPTVILDAGLGDSGHWGAIIPSVQSRTRVCSYNRAGLGESDPAPKRPRTSRDMVQDLHTLLINARVSGPYVLVGHSIAGYNIRVFANQYPQEVAGMVMIDCTPTDYRARWFDMLPPEARNEIEDIRRLRLALTTEWTNPDGNPEGWDFPSSEAQVRASGGLGTIPLVVLTAGKHDLGAGLPANLAQRIEQDLFAMHEAMAKLSSSGTHIVAKDSGHGIQQDQPAMVVDAIVKVVSMARSPTPVPTGRNR